LLAPDLSFRISEAPEGFLTNLDAVPRLKGYLIVAGINVNRSDKVFVQMIDELDDAILKRCRDRKVVED
jgi:hypothetical protein